MGDLQGHSACSEEDGCPLACDGGKPGKLNKRRGPWSHRSVACVDPSRLNQVIEDAPDAGGWGGECTCPDGQLYQVGDEGPPRTLTPARTLTLALAQTLTLPLRLRLPLTPTPTPTPTPPQVGDKDYTGKELACVGGKAGKINQIIGAWSHRKVGCSANPHPNPQPQP